MAKPIQVTDVQYTVAEAVPVNGSGRLSAGSAFVAGIVLGAWLTGGWACDDNPTPGPGSDVVQEQKTADNK